MDLRICSAFFFLLLSTLASADFVQNKEYPEGLYTGEVDEEGLRHGKGTLE